MKGKLIVLEGTDASGKSTQFQKLCEALDGKGIAYRTLTFPRYQEDSSLFLRMYLKGEFGDKPDDVSAYTASTFFALDRYVSYKKDWQEYYENGGLILADRYTTSNAVHQASKLEGEERDRYLDWMFDYEYRIMELPAPDEVWFLDMPTEAVEDLLIHRTGKTMDIHEKDLPYLKRCYDTATVLANRFGWHRIRCVKDGKIRSIEDISAQLTAEVLSSIEENKA